MHKICKLNIFVAILFVGCLFALTAVHSEINSGFVNGLWYSQNPFYADQTVRIYTAIYNNNPFDIRGVVEFQDGDQIIGTSSFTALAGRTEEAWMDWKAVYGSHRLSANFTKMEKMEIGKEPVSITWTGSAMSNQIFVDRETLPTIPAATVSTPNQTTAGQPNGILNSWNTLVNDTSSTAQLVSGEKISALASGIKFLQNINAAESVIAAKISEFLARQKEKVTPAVLSENNATGTIQWQDATSSDGLIAKICRPILNILLWLLKLPPLLLTLGIFILLITLLRLWFKWRRWHHGRY